VRRLYMFPYDELLTGARAETGTAFALDGSAAPVMQPVGSLFDSDFGAHGIYYPEADGAEEDYGGMALVITGFTDDRLMDIFHAILGVAILPNPAYAGTKPLSAHVDAAGYNFTDEHLDCLLTWTGLGAVASDTVLTLCAKARAFNPMFDLQLNTF
jgi:hypothetical protein